MSSHYGYKLWLPNEKIKSDLQKVLKHFDNSLHTNYSIDEGYLSLKGIWPVDAIKQLCQSFDVDVNSSGLQLKQSEGRIENNKLYSLLNFQDQWQDYYNLIGNSVYYSGVMPCVRNITYDLDPSFSKNIKYLSFEVIRTTFATVDMMDNSGILKHYFFAGRYKEILDYFDLYEDILQEKYLYGNEPNTAEEQIDYELNEIEKLNHYLSRSLNSHTIAVSSNLVTSDDYLLAGKRGNLNIDSGEIYCSANGQTEFRDENVAFYQKSVFEDLPTLDFYSKYRIDLNQEIERESIAELGITSYDPNWEYYGISYLSINNGIKGSEKEQLKQSLKSEKRRMYFNVLMNNQVTDTFDYIIKRQREATESIENESILGYKVSVSDGKINYFTKKFKSAFHFLYENNSIVILMLIFLSTLFGYQQITMFSVSEIFEIIFIAIFIGMNIYTWGKSMEIRRLKVTKHFQLKKYKKGNNIDMELVISDLSKKTTNKHHAIFNVMFIFHFLSLIRKNSEK